MGSITPSWKEGKISGRWKDIVAVRLLFSKYCSDQCLLPNNLSLSPFHQYGIDINVAPFCSVISFFISLLKSLNTSK